MPVKLTLNLSPSTQSGMSLSARIYTGNALATTLAMTETPSGSARYTVTTSALLANTVYDITVVNGSGDSVASGEIRTDASGNNADYLLDAAITSRLAPTVAGRTLLVGANNLASADVAAMNGNTVAASGLSSMGSSYNDFGFIGANVLKWAGVNVGGMPMATYAQPAGFLAATFPTTVSSYAGGPVSSVTSKVAATIATGDIADLSAARAAKIDNLNATISSRSVPGDAMALTPAERDATASRVEYHLIDEADGQTIINAIVGAIGNTNIDQVALVAAIRSDIERTGGTLALTLARALLIPTDPLRVGSYVAPDNATIGLIQSRLPASPASEGNVTAVGSAVSALGGITGQILAKFQGITLLRPILQALGLSKTPDDTALSELNAGGGTFSPSTDSLQALSASVAEIDDAMSGGGGSGGVIAGPVYASLPTGVDLRRASRISITQHAATRLPIDVYGADGLPVDLTDRTLKFVVFDDFGEIQFSVESADIEIGTGDLYRCYVQIDASVVVDNGNFRWTLWDVTDSNQPFDLGRGPLNIELAAI